MRTVHWCPNCLSLHFLPLAKQAAAEQMNKEMADVGITEPSRICPAVLIKNRDDTWWFCINYRCLNDITRKDCYPVLHVYDALDYISGSYSSLDLCSGYWQVGLTPEVCSKTAFSIGQGPWQFPATHLKAFSDACL